MVQEIQKKRGSEQEIPGPTPSDNYDENGKPLRHARSKAEIVRVWQGYAMIALALSNIALTVMIYLTR